MKDARKVRIGRTDIHVPPEVTQVLAEEIAERLSSRLRQIEEDFGRVDTIGHALQLAFDASLQLRKVSEEQEQRSAELIKALGQINDEIEKILNATPPAPKVTPFQRPTV